MTRQTDSIAIDFENFGIKYREELLSIKGTIKQGLLTFGGYDLARKLNSRYEQTGLERRIRTFLETEKLPLPDAVMFEPTQRCNLNCTMCYQDRSALKGAEEMSFDQIIQFFEHAAYLKKVTLIGGEVFLRKDMIELIQYLEKRRDLIVCTNGTLISRSEVEILKTCRHIFSVDISLDGPEKIHDSIRNVNGAFQKVTWTIRELAPLFPVTVNCVIQNENVGSLPAVVDICNSLGVKQLKFEMERLYPAETITQTLHIGLVPDGIPLPEQNRTRSYSLEMLRDTLRKCQAKGKKAGMYITFSPPYLMEKLDDCYAGSLRSERAYTCMMLRTATVAPDGTIVSCYALRFPFGHILETPLENIWQSDTATAYRKRLFDNNLTPLCENCPFMTPFG